MFNLPWYSWLNVLAIPCLWGILSLNSSMASRPAFFRKLLKVQILAAVVSIFLYWNPSISDELLPVHYVLILLILPLLLWNFGAVVFDLVQIGWIKIKRFVTSPPTPPPTPASEPKAPAIIQDMNDIDLDGGVSPLLREKEVGEAISGLFSSCTSAGSKLNSISKLLGEADEDEIDENGIYIVIGLLIYGLIVSVVLISPAFMSLSMAGLFR